MVPFWIFILCYNLATHWACRNDSFFLAHASPLAQTIAMHGMIANSSLNGQSAILQAAWIHGEVHVILANRTTA